MPLVSPDIRGPPWPPAILERLSTSTSWFGLLPAPGSTKGPRREGVYRRQPGAPKPDVPRGLRLRCGCDVTTVAYARTRDVNGLGREPKPGRFPGAARPGSSGNERRGPSPRLMRGNPPDAPRARPWRSMPGPHRGRPMESTRTVTASVAHPGPNHCLLDTHVGHRSLGQNP